MIGIIRYLIVRNNVNKAISKAYERKAIELATRIGIQRAEQHYKKYITK